MKLSLSTLGSGKALCRPDLRPMGITVYSFSIPVYFLRRRLGMLGMTSFMLTVSMEIYSMCESSLETEH